LLKTGTNYMSISFRFMITAACCLVLFSASAHLMDSDSLRLEKQGGRYFVIHEVEAKETLYSLSKRYGAEIDSITRYNELRNGGIDLGQLLLIPVTAPEIIPEVQKVVESDSLIDTRRKTHVVEQGQTVYFISKKYEIEFEDLRSWNSLSDDNLSIGMTLYVSPPVEEELQVDKQAELINEVPVAEPEEAPVLEEEEKESKDHYTHYVQSGETLSQLARRFETIPDSLISWNELENTTLRIGDKLLVKKPIERDSLNHSNPRTRFTSYGSKYWKEMTELDTLVHEEGIAGTIENIIETRKFLALHRTLPVGAVMKVVNLMNHESLEVRVVGKLPNTGLNRNMMIRFTEATFKQLGIIDKKSRVEIIYTDDKG
jgi:LysM repeat protein